MLCKSGFLVVLLSLIFLGGCSVVYIHQPLSEKSETKDKSVFIGDWKAEDGVLHLQFDSKEILHFATIEWKDDMFVMETGYAIVTEVGSDAYLSVKIKEDDGYDEDYVIVKCERKNSDELVIYYPDKDIFEAAVKDKQLEGTIEKYDIRITSSPQNVRQFLLKTNAFSNEDPLILKKISRSEPQPMKEIIEK